MVWVSAIRRNLEADLDLDFPGSGLEVGVDLVHSTQVGHLDRERSEVLFAKFTVVVVFVRVEAELGAQDLD